MKISIGKNTATIKANTWDDARLLGNHLSQWLFRGQCNSKWLLKSSVERALESRNIALARHPAFELLVLEDFRAVAHNYTNFVPKDEDFIGWLSLIQHYGGPTRLLDFTKSFYIASYFALDGAENECVIWAINRPELIKILPTKIEDLATQLGKQNNNIHEKIDAILRASISGDLIENILLTATPLKRSERQFTQKGISLIPLNLKNGYMGSLLGTFSTECKMPEESHFDNIKLDSTFELVNSFKIIKIILPKSCFLNARLDLSSMNLNAFSSFGGLDGLGKHLSDILNSVESYEQLKKSTLL